MHGETVKFPLWTLQLSYLHPHDFTSFYFVLNLLFTFRAL